mmetsp:Transcript_18347/g.62413  ORF Transcript_18347/g.62413 Transcript_18347/m.62413 type:complete len:333 (+) Transcript_18347:1304-2302(+)
MSSSSTSHVSRIACRACSMLSSLVAFTDVSAMKSACTSRRSSVTFARVKSSPLGSNSSPTAAITACQWRGRIAWLRSELMSGIVFLNASMMSLMDCHELHPRMSRPSFCTRLAYVTAEFSISSTSRSRNLPSFHPSYDPSHSRTIVHSAVSCSSSFSVCSSSLSGGCGMPKISMPALRSLSFLRKPLALSCACSTAPSAASRAPAAFTSATWYGAISSNSVLNSATSLTKPSTIFASFSRKFSFAFSRSISVSASVCWNVSQRVSRPSTISCSFSVTCTPKRSRVRYMSRHGPKRASVGSFASLSSLSRLTWPGSMSRLLGGFERMTVFSSK